MRARPTLEPGDDGFHEAGDDPWWTETAWYSVEDEERRLSLTVYPLFRPNLAVASLAIFAWDPTGSNPWDCRYWNFRWHLPMPEGDLTDLAFEGLRYRTLERHRRYRVSFDDPGKLSFELDWIALDAAWIKTGGDMLGVDLSKRRATRIGHFEQACAVKGQVDLGGTRFDFDTVGMRDRSWSPRPDRSARGSLFHCFGMSKTDGHFVVNRSRGDGGPIEDWRPSSGYLMRDGEMIDIERARLRVVGRSPSGEPTQVELEARDQAGRSLELSGECANLMFINFNPNLFARFQQTLWRGSGSSFLGEYMSPVSPKASKAGPNAG
jgi:hypothetical protein